ncbi:MAG: hypothetical protein OER82_10890 [Nitrosopumilus sp.]|nr:hypothetical protein [Nitrosopumilus sp.]
MMEKNNVVETTAESYEVEIDSTERKPRSRERGPDKKPRTYKANSMSNLTQFNQRPEEFAKYLKDEKGVDITGNSGIVKALLIFGVAMIAIFGGLWLYNHYKNGRHDNIENKY